MYAGSAANNLSGNFTIANVSGNTWVESGVVAYGSNFVGMSGGLALFPAALTVSA
jgi:hypothetical protein